MTQRPKGFIFFVSILFLISGFCWGKTEIDTQSDTKASANIIQITTKHELKKYIQPSRVVALKFHASWCHACRAFAPIYQKMAQHYASSNVVFLEANTENSQSLADAYDIYALPTTLLFTSSADEPVHRITGANQQDLQTGIEKALGKKASAPTQEEKQEASTVADIEGEEQFNKLLKQSSDLIIAEFHAESWCGACKMFKPLFAELASKSDAGELYVKIDVDNKKNQKLAQEYAIEAIPTIILFQNGEKLVRIEGGNIEKLKKQIKHHKNNAKDRKKSSPKKSAQEATKVEQVPVASEAPSPDKADAMVSEVKGSQFDDIIQVSSKPVVAKFYATWCGHCSSFKPKFEAIAEALPQAQYIAIDVDASENKKIATGFSVQGLPTIIIFKDGAQRARVEGAREDEVRRQIQKHL